MTQPRSRIGATEAASSLPTTAGVTTFKVFFVAAALWAVVSGDASAHSFTAALLIVGEEREESLAEAVRGFLLATDERDGHMNETSDGHLGGVDVQVLALPRDAAGLVEGLVGTPDEVPDVLVVIGPELSASEAALVYQWASPVLLPGVLPEGWDMDARADSFVARFRRAYGTAPGEVAVTAYNAARRLDAAIRTLDGVSPRAALENALRTTEAGLPW